MGNMMCNKSTSVDKQQQRPPTMSKPNTASNTVDAAVPTPTPTTQSLYYFDANMSQRDFEELPPTQRDTIAQSIYFETRQSMVASVLPYAPATVRNPHQIHSISLDKPDTLLSVIAPTETKEKKSVGETVLIRRQLNEPESSLNLRGYPGELTQKELEQCLAFRRELKTRDRTYHDMVHVYSDVEEESEALCRFLRARKFDSEKVLELMSPHLTRFGNAQANDFYRDIDSTLGCPLSVFLTQFPFLFSGVAKNGCAAAYFTAERLSIDGLECLTDLDEKIICFIWYALTHALTDQVSMAKRENSNGARCEIVMVVDLKGMPKVTSRLLDVFGKLAAATGSFPEILNRVVLVNASSFFALTWKVIQKFLDPRTRAKIEIHSDSGKERLAELIDQEQLLADFGGNGPTFTEAALEPRAGSADPVVTGPFAQTTELMSLSRSKEAKLNFSLSAKEQADVLVFTRSTKGAKVSVLGEDDTKVMHTTVQSNDGGPCCTQICQNKRGPGKFTVAIENQSGHKTTENFLLVVQVTPM